MVSRLGNCILSYVYYQTYSDGFDNNKENTNQSPKPSDPSDPSAFPSKCYHCELSEFEDKADYDSHCILRHPKKPGYPNKADIQALNLSPQYMTWEKL